MDLLIVTGMSGSGKSTALKALEDIGFYCIDNFPPTIFKLVYELAMQGEMTSQKIAITLDIRSYEMFHELENMINFLNDEQVDYKILFIDAHDDILLTRYKETRRSHPLMNPSEPTLAGAIQKERRELAYLRGESDFLIDTSSLRTADFKQVLIEHVGEGMQTELSIHFVSFGFKHGMLNEADLVFDLRCLKNPFYLPELRPLTGQDQAVRDYVMSFEESQGLYRKIEDYLSYSVPLYCQEGKSQLVVGLGCTGGQHRSVSFAKLLAENFEADGVINVERHRDIDK